MAGGKSDEVWNGDKCVKKETALHENVPSAVKLNFVFEKIMKYCGASAVRRFYLF